MKTVCVVSLYDHYINGLKDILGTTSHQTNFHYMRLKSADRDNLHNFFGAEKVLLVAAFTQRGFIIPQNEKSREESQLGRVYFEAVTRNADIFMIMADHEHSRTFEGQLYSSKLTDFLQNQPCIQNLAHENKFMSIGQMEIKEGLNKCQISRLLEWVSEHQASSRNKLNTKDGSKSTSLVHVHEIHPETTKETNHILERSTAGTTESNLQVKTSYQSRSSVKNEDNAYASSTCALFSQRKRNPAFDNKKEGNHTDGKNENKTISDAMEDDSGGHFHESVSEHQASSRNKLNTKDGSKSASLVHVHEVYPETTKEKNHIPARSTAGTTESNLQVKTSYQSRSSVKNEDKAYSSSICAFFSQRKRNPTFDDKKEGNHTDDKNENKTISDAMEDDSGGHFHEVGERIDSSGTGHIEAESYIGRNPYNALPYTRNSDDEKERYSAVANRDTTTRYTYKTKEYPGCRIHIPEIKRQPIPERVWKVESANSRKHSIENTSQLENFESKCSTGFSQYNQTSGKQEDISTQSSAKLIRRGLHSRQNSVESAEKKQKK